jgi:hypothetical protein
LIPTRGFEFSALDKYWLPLGTSHQRINQQAFLQHIKLIFPKDELP